MRFVLLQFLLFVTNICFYQSDAMYVHAVLAMTPWNFALNSGSRRHGRIYVGGG